MKIKELNENNLGTIIDVESSDPEIIYKHIRKYYKWIKFNQDNNLLSTALINAHREDFKEAVDEFIDIGLDDFLSTRQRNNLQKLKNSI